jgi:hypothetical protein
LEDFGWLVFVSLLIGACYHRQITTTKREEIKNRRWNLEGWTCWEQHSRNKYSLLSF